MISSKFKTIENNIEIILNYFKSTFNNASISFKLDRRFEGNLSKEIVTKGFKRFKLDKPSSLYFKNNQLNILSPKEELDFKERKLKDKDLYSLNYHKIYDAWKSSYIKNFYFACN